MTVIKNTIKLSYSNLFSNKEKFSFEKNFPFFTFYLKNTFHFSFKKALALFFIFHFSFITYSQSLTDYIALAKQNSSKIQSLKADFEIAKEKTKELATYDNTSFSFGVFPNTVETRVGSQLINAEISQKLPWFGTLKAQKKLADAEAKLFSYDTDLYKKELAYKISKLYYELYEKQAVRLILKDNKTLLKTYEDMAIAALANNKATMSDVLKIRIQKNELHSKTFQTLNSIEALSKNFNRLLERDINEQLNIPSVLDVTTILVGKTEVSNHPLLAKEFQKEQNLSLAEKLIKKKQKPQLKLAASYTVVAKYASNPIGNGKDISYASIGLSLPLFNAKYKSQLKQNALKKEQIKANLNEVNIALETALETAKLAFENALIQVVAAEKNKEEVQRALNVDLKAYETGMLNYDRILKTQLQKIRYELMEVSAVKNAFVAKARIDYLIK